MELYIKNHNPIISILIEAYIRFINILKVIVKMAKNIVTLLLICSIIFIVGCAQNKTITVSTPSEQENISGISDIVIQFTDQETKKELANAKITFYIDSKDYHFYSGGEKCWNYQGQKPKESRKGEPRIISVLALCPPYIQFDTISDEKGIASLPKEEINKAIQRAKLEGKNMTALFVFIDVEAYGYFSKLYVNQNSFTFPLVEYKNLNGRLELKPYTITSEQAIRIADTDSKIIDWKKSYPNFSVNVSTWGGAGLWIVKYEDKTCSYGNQTNAAGNLVSYKFCSARSVLINALNGTVQKVSNIDTRYFSNGNFNQ